MTSSEFSSRILEMTDTLYRVSYSFLRERCDREDAVQECILKAWRKRGSLREERYLQTWVIRILINECHNILRRSRRETALDGLPEHAALTDHTAPPDADFALHDALFRLPETLRTPIVLHYMEGYGTLEIAKMLRLAQGTVKSRMRRARGMLKDMLKEGPIRESHT